MTDTQRARIVAGAVKAGAPVIAYLPGSRFVRYGEIFFVLHGDQYAKLAIVDAMSDSRYYAKVIELVEVSQ